MSRLLVLLGAAALTLLAACSSDSDSTSTPTGEATTVPTSGPGAAPTAAAPVDASTSFVALINLATLQQTTIHDGPGIWNAWFEADGKVVNALVLGDGVAPRTVRIGIDGSVIADSTSELQVRVTADGSARTFGGPSGDGFTFQTLLEVDGALVELDGDPTALPLGFSPDGAYLLSYVGVAAEEGEAAISYTVHNLDGSVGYNFVNRLSATNPGSSPPAWSPSGQYVATIGLQGVGIHEVESGQTFLVQANGSTEWSDAEDALILVTSDQELQVLRMPDLETLALDVPTVGITASFDPTGSVVSVSDFARRVTTVFDAVTGEQLLELGGVAETSNVIGFEPIIMTDSGLAAVLEHSPGCDGIQIIHPALGNRGQCLTGTNPRWAPDASAVSVTRGSEIVVFNIETLSELVVASGLPIGGTATLARWNERGTQLLLEWPWGGSGWTDSLP